MRRSIFKAGASVSLFAAAVVCLSPSLRAATFEGLYTVAVAPNPEAPVTSRTDAVRRAMAVLLTRITGRREAGAYPELQTLIDQAERRYVTQYGELEGGRIRVGFNASSVARDLESMSWPIWGAERPMTLLWIAVDYGNGQRALLGGGAREPSFSPEVDEFMDDLEEQILAVADERGLPVTLPLLDLQDQQAIQFADVWGGFSAAIEQASARYEADTVLIGRVEVTQYGLEVRWTTLQDGRGAMILGTNIRDGLDWLADQYASEFVIVGAARQARISVVGIGGVSDYLRVMSHLNTLSVLQIVDVEELSGDTLTLRVAARGDDSVLQRVLTLGGVLEVDNRSLGPQTFGSNLVFRIAGSARPL